MTKYSKEIEDSEKLNIFRSDEIFDFQSTPNEEIFSKFYKFCRDNLDIQSSKLNLDPNIFVFYNSTNVNARAGKKNDTYVMAINSGLIIWCISNFITNKNLDKYVEINFPQIANKFDSPVSILSMQIATQFTYYHECSHLIQLSKSSKEISLQERTDKNSNYDKVQHMLEINADTYASIALASHFQQYLENSFGEKISENDLSNSLKILCSFLISYISSFSDSSQPIYFAEKSHPHPFIRIFNVILNIVHYLNQGNYLKNNFIQYNISKLFSEIFDFYLELEEQKIFLTNFKNNYENGAHFQNEISNYLGELIEFKSDIFFNAIEKWNEQIN